MKYDCSEIPETASRSIFIAIPKKPGTNHSLINLINHITKVYDSNE